MYMPDSSSSHSDNSSAGTPVMPVFLHGTVWDESDEIRNIAERSGADRYRVGGKIARGGMGDLFEAVDSNCGRTVALKRIRSGLSTQDVIRRFLIEARITAQLEHPNIVPVHELSVDGEGRVFYAMKRIRGITLLHILGKMRVDDPDMLERYSLVHLLNIFQDICDAVAYAHSKGIIHRDLKPENVMVGDYGEVLVLDWGIAKVLHDVPGALSPPPSSKISGIETPVIAESVRRMAARCDALPTDAGIGGGAPDDNGQADSGPLSSLWTAGTVDSMVDGTGIGEILGTAGYMSPEQADGDVHRVTARSDVFSLGAILYFLLTLRAPFSGSRGRTMYEKIKAGRLLSPLDLQRRQSPDDESVRTLHCPGGRVPASLSAVAMKAMAYDPDARYQSVEDLQRDIRNYQTGFATAAEDAGAGKLIWLFICRHRILAACLVVVFLLSLVFVARLAQSERTARVQQALAEENAAARQVESLRANYRLADSLLAEGNALGALSRWEVARAKFHEAVDVLNAIDAPDLAARLGLWQSYRRCPPAINILADHQAAALAVDISENGCIGVAGFADGTIVCWDLPEGTAIRCLRRKGATSPVTSVEISRTGMCVIAGRYNGEIDVWDMNTGTCRTLYGHSRWIYAVAVSADGRKAASAGADGKVLVWDLDSAAKVVAATVPGWVNCLAFAGDGRRLVCGGANRAPTVWDVADGSLLEELAGGAENVNAITFAPPGNHVVTGSHDGYVHVHNLGGGGVERFWTGHASTVLSVDAGNNALQIVAGQKNMRVTTWETATGMRSTQFYHGVVAAMALSSHAGVAMGADTGGTVTLLATRGDREVAAWHGHRGTIECAAFSPDLRLIASGGWDQSVVLWDRAAGRILRTLSGHTRAVSGVGFVAGGAKVVSAGLDGAILLTDLAGGATERVFAVRHPIVRLAVAPSGSFAVFGDRSGQIWACGFDPVSEPVPVTLGDSACVSLALSADGAVAAALFASGTIHVWTTVGSKQVREFHVPGARCVAASPLGGMLAVGTANGSTLIIDAADGTTMRRCGSGQSPEITAVAFGPEGAFVYAADKGGAVIGWQYQGADRHVALPGHDRRINALALSPDGRYLVTGGRDRILLVRDFHTPDRYRQLSLALSGGSAAEFRAANVDSERLRSVGVWYAFMGADAWASDFLACAQDRGVHHAGPVLARSYQRLGLYREAAATFALVNGRTLDERRYIDLCRRALDAAGLGSDVATSDRLVR